MKLGLLTKLDKKNKTMSKKSIDDDMSANYDVSLFFNLWPICSHPEAGF